MLDEGECVEYEGGEGAACDVIFDPTTCTGTAGCFWDEEECAQNEGEGEAAEPMCEDLDPVTCGNTAGCFVDEGECATSEAVGEYEVMCEGLDPTTCASTSGCISEEGECTEASLLNTHNTEESQPSTKLVSIATVGIVSFVFGLGCATIFFRATQKTDDTYAIMLDDSQFSSRIV